MKTEVNYERTIVLMIPLRIGMLNFDCVIKQKEKPVLLVFGAVWNFNSRQLYELLGHIPARFEKKIIVGIVDEDYAPELFTECNISELPTTIIYENGKEFERRVGYTDSDDIRRFLSRFFGITHY